MISREEFNHQLQTGKISSALASVLQSLNELEITTQIEIDGANRSNSIERPYFRTKIDLLGGRVVDEVSVNIADDDRYLQLQRGHAERVAASYDLARDYLERIQSLLAALPDAPKVPARPMVPLPNAAAVCERPLPPNDRFDNFSAAGYANNSSPKSPPPALVAKLQQARASLTSRLGSDVSPAMLFPSRTAAADLAVEPDLEAADVGDESGDIAIGLEISPATNCGLSADDLAAVTTIVDEEIDLAIEENGELWAGWVEEDSEDEDEYNLAALSPQPPAHPTLLNWQEIPSPKYVDPIEVKPIITRSVARSIDPIDQWDKFEPDYLGIDFDPPPAIKNHLPIDN